MLTRAGFADRLSEATVRRHYHPIEDIDWDVELDLERFYVPERLISIHGTEIYERLSARQKRLLSLYESVSNLSTGIWLENVLMYGFLDRLYDKDHASPDYRYMLHEVADEANHSIMFHQYLRKAGLGPVPVTRPARAMGTFFRRYMPRMNPYLFFIGVLAGEEPPEYFGQANLREEGLHPLPRRISEIHSFEESRHIAYAREYLSRNFHAASRWHRTHAEGVAPVVVKVIVSQFVWPRWPAGSDAAPEPLRFPPELRARIAEARRTNPARRQVALDSLRRLVPFLEEIGAITSRSRWAWRRFGLAEA